MAAASLLGQDASQFTNDVSTRFFLYKKLGSGHSTKSFLISHEISSILVLKVGFLFLNAELAMWSLTLWQICFLTFKTS